MRADVPFKKRTVPTLAERFWEKVDKRGDDDCWEWTGCTSRGYGKVNIDGVPQRAHRVAWMLTHDGEVPDEHVLHSCDNPPCCNPRHLFLGSQQDNITDMVVKGRGFWQ